MGCHCAFPATPTRQHQVGTWSHHCGLRATPTPCSHLACRALQFPHPLPALLPDRLLWALACQRDLDLPLGVLLLPHPQPLLAPLGCNTNHPVPAGHREPQNSPLYFGRVLPACPTTSGLGAGKQYGGHSGSRGLGIAALLWAKSTRPFCISARHGQRVPALSPVMAAGAGDGGGAPQLQGNLIWVFIV